MVNWTVGLILVVVIVVVSVVLKFVLGISFALMWVILLGILGGLTIVTIAALVDYVEKPWKAWGISSIICAAIAAWWIYF